ncbi:MAG: response regulator [Spirochaetales bacterium]|nr:response regulator [Spirochaetales bacterium]
MILSVPRAALTRGRVGRLRTLFEAIGGILVAFLGAALNATFAFDLGFGIQLLAGGVFGAFAAMIMPWPAGALGPLVAALPTLALWSHPWALPSAFLEGLLISFLSSRRQQESVLLAGPAYWTLIGAPLVALLYQNVGGMDAESVFASATKQGFNASIACAIAVIPYRIYERYAEGRSRPRQAGARSALTILLHASLAIPLVSGVLVYAGQERGRIVGESEEGAATILSILLEEHRSGGIDLAVAATLSRTGFEAGIRSSDPRTAWQSPGWPALGNLASGAILHRGERASIRSDPHLANPLVKWKRAVVLAELTLDADRTLEVRAPFGPRIASLLSRVGYLFAAGLVWMTFSAMIATVLASRFAKDLERLRLAAERAQATASGGEGGEVTVRWPTGGVLEIRELRDSLVAMAGAYQNRRVELAEAKATAERLMRKSEAYLAFMGHELKAPLAALRSAFDAASESPELLARTATMARASIDRLLELVNDLLDCAAATGAPEVRSAPFVPSREAVAVLEPFSIQARRKGLAFGISSDAGLDRTVLGDAPRFRQVLANLVGNAIKYTKDGGIEVGFSTRQEDGRLVVDGRVSDSGIGIAPARAKEIWIPFASASGTLGDGTSSHGLGLSIVRSVVEAMGGSVDYEPREGGGSIFAFTLPFELERRAGKGAKLSRGAKATPRTTDEANAGAAARVSQRLEGVSALVADDDDISRLVMTHWLRARGAAVVEGGTGAEALEAFGSRSFELVVLDRYLPDRDGTVVARELRGIERRESRPPALVLLSSAERPQEAGFDGPPEGVDGFLPKPVTDESLDEALSLRFGNDGDGRGR